MLKTPFLLLAASLLAAQSGPTGLAPTLYSKRGTDLSGSSLVLREVDGSERIVAEDGRPASRGGLLSAPHGSSLGPFSMAPDGSKVLYTLMGKASSSPKATGGGMTIGGFGFVVVVQDRFNNREMEGLYLWDRETGKSQCLWNQEQLEDLLEAWVRTPAAKAMELDHKPHKVLDLNVPKYMFHLEGDRFLLVVSGFAYRIDAAAKTLQVLHAYQERGGPSPRQPKPAPGSKGADSRPMPNEYFTAWQDGDGTVNLLDSSEWTTISAAGEVKSRWIPAGTRFSRLDGDTLVVGDQAFLHVVQKPKESVSAPRPVVLDTPNPASSGGGAYLHRRGAFTRVDGEGKELWKVQLTNLNKLYCLVESADHVDVLGNDRTWNRPWYMTVNSRTGAVLAYRQWRRTAPNAEAFAADMECAPLTSIPLEQDWMAASQDGKSIFAYTHFRTRNDLLTRLDRDGKVMWTADLGNCRKAFFLLETSDRLVALVKRGSDDEPHRLSLDPDTGKVLEDTLWKPSDKPGSTPRLSFALLPEATVLQTPAGALVWLPARGRIRTLPGASSASPSLGSGEDAPEGAWAVLDANLELRPLWVQPLLDQCSYRIGDRVVPVPTWNNQGIRTGKAAGPPIPFGNLMVGPGAPFGPWNGLHGMSRGESLHVSSSSFICPQELLGWAADIIRKHPPFTAVASVR